MSGISAVVTSMVVTDCCSSGIASISEPSVHSSVYLTTLRFSRSKRDIDEFFIMKEEYAPGVVGMHVDG